MNKLWLLNHQSNCIFIACLDNLVRLYDWGDILITHVFIFLYTLSSNLEVLLYVDYYIRMSAGTGHRVAEGPFRRSVSK